MIGNEEKKRNIFQKMGKVKINEVKYEKGNVINEYVLEEEIEHQITKSHIEI